MPHRSRSAGSGRPERSAPRSATARRLAFDVLSVWAGRCDQAASGRAPAPVEQVLEERLSSSRLSPADRRLAVELVYGCIRREATLDAVLGAYVSRPRGDVETGLWVLLRLGAYQLCLLTSIPPHAAVGETVQLAREIGRPQWSGMLNGVLRNIARGLDESFVGAASTRAFPFVDRRSWEAVAEVSAEARSPGTYRRLDRDLFADPGLDPAGYLAAAGSLPRWLVDRWLPRYGFSEVLEFARWFDGPGRLSLRVNVLQTDRVNLLGALAEAGIAATPGSTPACLRLERTGRVEELPGYAEGWFSVQDESAQEAAALIDPRPGEQILDLCAAPGGKATHLAELLGDRGRVVAADVHAARIERIRESAARLRLTCVETVLIPDIRIDGVELPAEACGATVFDAALVDAPCSNTGVLGKRPEARWRITPDDLQDLPRLQRRLLGAAIQRVRRGGRVVYSTCSIEPEENGAVVQAVLRDHPVWTLTRERAALPGRPGDGGYLALLNSSER